MINYSTYINESAEDVGRKVKIRDDSRHKNEAYNGGNGKGNGEGVITKAGTPSNEEDYVYKIKWNSQYSDRYRRKDFDFIEDVEDVPVRVRWYKDGKLNERVNDISGSRVKVKDHSIHKEKAYKHGGNGYGIIVDLSGKDFWEPSTKIQYYYYYVIWDNGYESSCRIGDIEIEIEPEPFKIRWYKDGKLNEDLYGDEHVPSDDDVGKRVKICDDSGYRSQAYTGGGNGKGTIVIYYNEYYKGRYDDHVYRIKWDSGNIDSYRLCDIEWEEENKPVRVRIRWYKKGHLSEGVKWYSKGKLTLDPDNDINVPEYPEYNDFITNDKFRQFLIDNRCLSQYIKNCDEDFIEDFDNADKSSYIDNAFSWSDSPEGDYFWSDIDEKWREII